MPFLHLPNFEPTAWERKLRAYRLKNETPKPRVWREEAEAPNTTGERLAWLTANVYEDTKLPKHWGSGITVRQALARHPNTPPASLAELIYDCAGDFCQNPVAPFVMLEVPDFVGRIKAAVLLQEENAPLALLKAMAAHPELKNLDETRPDLHVALAGEIETVVEGEELVVGFWRAQIANQIAKANQSKNDNTLHLILSANGDLAELGLAPAWVNEPPLAIELSAPELSAKTEQWLGRTAAPGSPEENALWARVAPALAAQSEFAACRGQ